MLPLLLFYVWDLEGTLFSDLPIIKEYLIMENLLMMQIRISSVAVMENATFGENLPLTLMLNT